MMNNNDAIKPATKVYGFLSEYAQQNRFSSVMNSMFRDIGADAMIIPMNIRADDFYFTVSGLRNAKLNGVIIGKEYRHDVLELCDSKSSDVQACGFCDIVKVKEGKLYGDIFIGRALNRLFQDKAVTSLALYGSGALAHATLLHVKESSIKTVTLFNDRVESCKELVDKLGDVLAGIDVEIERADSELSADFSPYDMALNVADQEKLFSPVTSTQTVADLSQSGSPFSALSASEYLGYDALLPYMTQSAHTIFKGRE